MYPKVILIGGTPYSGKTTLAVKLASMLEYSCISTDESDRISQQKKQPPCGGCFQLE